MKKTLLGLLLAASFVLAACDTGTTDPTTSSSGSSDTETTDTTSSSDSTSTVDVRQEWTSDEIAMLNTYFFEGASEYIPCYVPEGGELTDAYFVYSTCLSVEAPTDSKTSEQLAAEYIDIIEEFGYYAEWYSDEWGYTYYYDLSDTAWLNIDSYYNSDYELFCIDIYYVNTVPTTEVREEWTSDEITMFNTYFFEGASEYIPCYVPEGGELTDAYFEDYGCLTLEAESTDTGLVYAYIDTLIASNYSFDEDDSVYYYDVPNSTSQIYISTYLSYGYFTIDFYLI